MLEGAELAFDKPAQTVAIVALKFTQGFDLVFYRLLFALVFGQTTLVLRLCLRDDACRLRVSLGDEFIALLNTFTHVFFVESSRELQEVRGAFSVNRVIHRGGRHRSSGRSRGPSALKLSNSRLSGLELVLELRVFFLDASHFDDDFVEKIVDLILVVSLTELRRLKTLVDDVFWCQCH